MNNIRVDNVKNGPSGITCPTSVSRQTLAYHHNSTLETGTVPVTLVISYAHAHIRIRGGARLCLVNRGSSPKWVDRTALTVAVPSLEPHKDIHT